MDCANNIEAKTAGCGFDKSAFKTPNDRYKCCQNEMGAIQC